MSGLWSDNSLGCLARELYRRSGLVFEGGQAGLFRKRVERRARELGYAGAPAYVADLDTRLGDTEYDRLIELLTVNETFFFRDQEQIRVLLARNWSRWEASGPGPVRLWSAACSTGCEPYTLAILLREFGYVGPGRPGVEILGTDLNHRVLSEARRAEYREFAFRSTPSYYREKYFRRENGRYRLDPSIRSMVRFRSFNLLQPTSLPEGPFHGVLCRNVLIYFDAEAKRRAVDLLTRSLRPDGVLVVGRAESLLRLPGAPRAVSCDGVTLYPRSRIER